MSYPYFFISSENISGNLVEISGDDFKHLVQVLRARAGDKVEISDNAAFRYVTEIIEIKKKSALLNITDRTGIKKEPDEVYLFQCILKRSSMELVIQKAAETGLAAVVPVKSIRVASAEKKDNEKLQRWQKIALEASKQSKRGFKCEVLNEISITNIDTSFFDIFYIPYEGIDPGEMKKRNIISSLQEIIPKKAGEDKAEAFISAKEAAAESIKHNRETGTGLKIGFIIGPEGGFDESEVEMLAGKGAIKLSLGKNILKAETASIFMSSVIKYSLEIL